MKELSIAWQIAAHDLLRIVASINVDVFPDQYQAVEKMKTEAQRLLRWAESQYEAQS